MSINIDLKDKKILFELDFDARQGYSELGKKVGLSKQVVEYRINNLVKSGIIKEFYPVVNVPKLGYFYCRLSLTLQNIGPEELQKMREDLLANEKAFWIIEMQGNFDLFFATWCKSLTEFRKFADDFMIKYSRYVKVKTENIATDVIHYQHRYLLGKKDTMELHVAETDKRVEIDELDKKILRLLCENARISLVDIGQKLKEHPKTIAYRISRLEKIKLIEAYRISIDHTKLGYTYYKIFLNISNYHNEEIKRLKEFIKRNPATIYIVEGIGLHADLDFEMMIKDNKELFDFIKELRKEFPKIIENYNTVIFMETLKVRYLPF
jgi:DNA-binding Lrp family transcriptional regulator